MDNKLRAGHEGDVHSVEANVAQSVECVMLSVTRAQPRTVEHVMPRSARAQPRTIFPSDSIISGIR